MFCVAWGMRAKQLGVMACFAFLATAASAATAATLTNPVNGQTVTLDKSLNFSFQWTLAPGETSPTVYVGDQPTFDPQNNFQPFNAWCGGNATVAYSCSTAGDNGEVAVAGVHYAVVGTYDANSNPLASPEIRFTVPYRVGLGCVPYVGCEWPKVSNLWFRFGDEGYPFPHTMFNVWGWTNGPTLTMAYVVRSGRRMLKHGRRTLTANVFGGVAQPDHLELMFYNFRGIAKGTPLRVTVTLTSGTAALTRTYEVRAGGGPKHGATARFEQ